MIFITFYLNQLFLLYALNESTIILPALNCSDKTKFNIVFGVEIKIRETTADVTLVIIKL